MVSYCKPWNETHFLFDFTCYTALVNLQSTWNCIHATIGFLEQPELQQTLAINIQKNYILQKIKKEKKKTKQKQNKGKKKHTYFLTFIAIYFVKYIGYSLVRIAFPVNLFLVNEITDDYTSEHPIWG